MSTKIEWTDETWNPTLGCDKVSPGCDGCFAIRTARIRGGNPHPKIAQAYAGLTKRTAGGLDWTGDVRVLPDRLDMPLHWRKPRKVFVDSQSDLFHDGVGTAFIARVFAVMAATPRHTYQVLTKRHGRMRSLLGREDFRQKVRVELAELRGLMVGDVSLPWPLPNVWLGVSVEDQQRADLRIPALLGTPAAVRWLSCEPLLGPVDLTCGNVRPEFHGPCDGYCDGALLQGIDWVVVGGETGPTARPMHPDWARGLRDQCQNADVPFWFKQWGDHLPVPVFDDPSMFGGRAFQDPRGGSRRSPIIRTRGRSGTFRGGETRLMQPGDRTRGCVMLDEDLIAVRVEKKAAGAELDGRTWQEFPKAVVPA